mgnify:FL=1
MDCLKHKYLNVAIDGCARKDRQGIRRSNKRQTFPSVSRSGISTGMPSLKDFLKKIGASTWFAEHTPRGETYKITYAQSRNSTQEPTMTLSVVSVKPVGKRMVYDLTIENLHNNY